MKEWKFKPATKDGDAVDSYTLVHLYFSPPTARLGGVGGGGSVWAETFYRSDLPTGLPGAPSPVSRSTGITSSHGGNGRPVAETFLRPPCGPRSGRCMYDRNQLRRDAKMRRGEPGHNHPAPGQK